MLCGTGCRSPLSTRQMCKSLRCELPEAASRFAIGMPRDAELDAELAENLTGPFFRFPHTDRADGAPVDPFSTTKGQLSIVRAPRETVDRFIRALPGADGFTRR